MQDFKSINPTRLSPCYAGVDARDEFEMTSVSDNPGGLDDAVGRWASSEEFEEEASSNGVSLLKKGHINRGYSDSPLHILLVGETGVGKSTIVELIANLVTGRPIDGYDYKVLDQSNEAGGPSNQSQTNQPRLYELHSCNGVLLRILDTPGLADTRGLLMDEMHKINIANAIETHMEYLNGVFIVVNGTVSRLTVSTDYALSTLSSIFPKSLADNIAFILTHVEDETMSNFAEESVPAALIAAPRYFLNNPLALQKRFKNRTLSIFRKQKLEAGLPPISRRVLMAEQSALETFAEVFKWLDERTPRPTSAILALHKQSQEIELKLTNIVSQLDQTKKKERALEDIRRSIENTEATMTTFSEALSAMKKKIWRLEATTHYNTVCNAPGCYKNCHKKCTLDFAGGDAIMLLACAAIDGNGSDSSWPVVQRTFKRCWIRLWLWRRPLDSTCDCKHPLHDHGHFYAQWLEIDDPSIKTAIAETESKLYLANTVKDEQKVICSGIKRTLEQLSASIRDNMPKLSELANDYARLSLCGNIVAHMGKIIGRLELILKNLEENGGNDEERQRVQDSLDTMRKKKDVFTKHAGGFEVVVYNPLVPAPGGWEGEVNLY